MKNSLPTLLTRSFFALALGISTLSSPAQTLPGPSGLKKDLKSIKEGPASKIGAEFITLKEEYTAFGKKAKANARVTFEPSNKLIQIRKGKFVVVDAVADGSTEALLADLKTLGAEQTATAGRVVSGLIPIASIDKLALLKSLRFARPAFKPYTNAGLVKSQGDEGQRSDLARSLYRVNGKGTTVGVLSDSYNNLTGAKAGTLTGDLPGAGNPDGYTKPVNVLLDLDGGGSDEGRAMLEIVHDVAPAANLAFNTAFNGQAGFAKGITDLADAGCDVIVDDIFYYFEPYFQDGIIAQAVDKVNKKGVAYFSSAGNQARQSYESAFKPSGTGYIGGEAHDFGPNDQFQRLFIPSGASVIIVLQWADPFFSVSGGDGAKTDLDLYLVDDSLTTIVAQSAFANVGDDPIEGFQFDNLGPDGFFNLLIENYEGPHPKILKYIIYGDAFPVEYDTQSSTTTGHANAAGAIATGAARYDKTPAFGVKAPILEYFSSAGGTPILYDLQGKELPKAELRKKPEITSVDGGNTTFFIPGLDYEDDGFPNFFGTSASAPHAAAVAALMLQGAKKSIKPADILAALQSTALDMDDPATEGFDKGFDFGTGSGLIQADKAVGAVYSGLIVTNFTLINADSDKELGTIDDNGVIVLGTLPSRNLNIRANVTPTKTGSVVFEFNGKTILEKTYPYALGGNVNAFDYRALVPALTPGDYTLTATPYAGPSGTGKKGESLTIKFKVTESQVTSLTLVDADTDKDILKLYDGIVLNLDELPSKNLNIRANTEPAVIGSVKFVFGSKIVLENRPPYALAGESSIHPIDYNALSPALKAGKYSLEATPYSLPGGKGIKGLGKKIAFSVSEDFPSEARKDLLAGALGADQFKATSNPFSGSSTLSFQLTEQKEVTLSIYDVRGALVTTLYAGSSEGGVYEVDNTKLGAGIYIGRLSTGNKVLNQKFVISPR